VVDKMPPFSKVLEVLATVLAIASAFSVGRHLIWFGGSWSFGLAHTAICVLCMWVLLAAWGEEQ